MGYFEYIGQTLHTVSGLVLFLILLAFFTSLFVGYSLGGAGKEKMIDRWKKEWWKIQKEISDIDDKKAKEVYAEKLNDIDKSRVKLESEQEEYRRLKVLLEEDIEKHKEQRWIDSSEISEKKRKLKIDIEKHKEQKRVDLIESSKKIEKSKEKNLRLTGSFERMKRQNQKLKEKNITLKNNLLNDPSN